MKMRYLHRLLFAAAAAVALVSCNKEQDKSADGLETDGPKNYMGFTISMPSAGTKAAGTGPIGDYVKGDDNENAIKTIHFYFYRKGAYVSWGYGDVANRFQREDGSGDVEEKLRHLTESTKGVVVLESTMAIPDQVLCVINSRDPNWYRNKNLDIVKDAIHSGTIESLTKNTTDSYKDFAFLEGTQPYFVMFTSPMFGKKADGVTDEVKYVTDIFVEETAPGSGKFTSESYIKNTRAEAEGKPLEVYVERMAARYDIDNLKKVPDGILKDDDNFVDPSKMDKSMKVGGLDTGDPIYDIKILSWSVTAHNKKAYSLKHIDTDWFSKTGVNEPFYGNWLQSGSSVTNPLFPSGAKMFSRINWTKDPNYSDSFSNRDSYPHSARELTAQSEEKYWSAEEIAANYAKGDWTQEDLIQRYSYENTFNDKGQESPRVAGTMLLLYAQVKKAPTTPGTTTGFENLYAYMGSQLQTTKEYAAHLLATMDNHGHTFYYEKTPGVFVPIHTDVDFINPSNNYLKVVKATKIEDFYGSRPACYIDVDDALLNAYPDMVVDLTGTLQAKDFNSNFPSVPTFNQNEEKGYADGYVTLVPNNYKTDCPTLYVENPSYDPADPQSKQYLEAEKGQIAEGFLNGVVEPANMYRDGWMYYAIPIEHYGKSMSSGTNPKPLEGNYGVVRNNFYKVSIGTFKSLGHGIDDVKEPIVPGDRRNPYYMAAKINILSWQVATQTHDLEE